MNFGKQLCALASLITLSISSIAATDEEAEESIMMEEVVVTARKREQRSFEVPLSVSTIRGEKSDALRSSGVDVRFLSNRTPSLQMESSFGRVFPRFYIRGLGNTDFDLNASQSVSVLHDGVVLENALLKGFPAFDLDRIEVLRGPQGTLFGRNTPAGAVKFESARPNRNLEGYGRLSYGRFNSVNFEGAVSGSLVPSVLAARLSLLTQRRGDWVDNEHTGEENVLGGHRDLAGRLQLLWTPTPELEAWFKYHTRDLDGTARLFRANILLQDEGDLVPDFARDGIAHDGRNEQTLRTHGLAAEVRYDIGNFQLVSLTGLERLTTFSRGDIDGGYGAVFSPPSGPGEIPFPSETASGIPALRQFSQEVRLMSPAARRLAYQFGVYYFQEFVEMEDFNYNTLAGGTLDGMVRQEQEATALAAFAAMSFQWLEDVEVSAGLRLSDDSKDYYAWREAAPAVTGAGPLGPVQQNPQARVWSGDLSLRYRAAPGVQTYLRAARGFRAPSIQGRLLFGDAVTLADTETILSVEGGTKLRLWEQRLHLNLAAFQYLMQDQQLTAVGGETNFNRLVNAESTVGRGVEAELTLIPMTSLEVSAGLSYNRTRIDDPKLAIQGCGAPCTVLDPPASADAGTFSIDGNGLPQAPGWIADVTARYVLALPAGAHLVASTDWAYRSRVRFFLYDSVEFADDWMLEGGVRLAYMLPNGDIEVALSGRNILNDTSPTGGIDFNNLTGYVNEPRYWNLELIRRF
ncbi:MAG: TonB-dependent receptor [Candidatus Poribacteria bacterium]|nr:TonB-dependent receptor [Candidatus Poribacteria bacterium]MDE0505666.1 TonB-dependent receptor [Candidatus Poribacteria bacterium]